MKLYYATLANDDALDDVMLHGIRRADGAEVVPLTDAPELAARVVLTDQDLYDRDVVDLFLYTVDIPNGEPVLPITTDNENLRGLPVYGYPGDIPPDWIPSEYTTMKLTANDQEVTD